jgi:hypothetical protein
LQPGGVALSTKSGSLPESFIRMRESDIVLGSSQSPQLDMMIDCWKTPRWWLQNPLPPAPQPPPNFEIRFTGSFPRGLRAVDVLLLMQRLLASDPNSFSSNINYDQTLLLVSLANYLITIRGTLVGWTAQP